MKNIFRFILSVAAAAFLFASCDKVKDEDRKTPYEGTFTSENVVLLEDYTGVRCVNCPNAAEETHRLMEFFGNNLIVVAMYPSNPAGLTMPFNPTEDVDMRTEEAQEYATHYAIEQFPNGMVNRNGKVQGFKSWGGMIDSALSAKHYASLGGSAYLTEDNTMINVKVSGGFTEKYSAKGDIRVIAMVVEDNIVSRQLVAGNVDPNYTHNHVMRRVITDVWGDKVLSTSNAGDVFDANFKGRLEASWKVQDLYVVAALVDAGTNEVLQAAKIEISEE